MKKLLLFGLTLMLLSISVSAQRNTRPRSNRSVIVNRLNNSQLTRAERLRLHRDRIRYGAAQRQARRDGTVTAPERRRLHRMKRHNRVELFRYKHNNRRRII